MTLVGISLLIYHHQLYTSVIRVSANINMVMRLEENIYRKCMDRFPYHLMVTRAIFRTTQSIINTLVKLELDLLQSLEMLEILFINE